MAEPGGHGPTRDLVEHGLELDALTVEHAHGRAGAEAEDLACVVGGVLGKLDARARRRARDVESCDAHEPGTS